MGIVLYSLPDSWECERKTIVEKASNLKYNEIILELKEQLEHQIQSSNMRFGKSKNALPWMKKMFWKLTKRESTEREHQGHRRNE